MMARKLSWGAPQGAPGAGRYDLKMAGIDENKPDEVNWFRTARAFDAVEKFEKGELIDSKSVEQRLSVFTQQQRLSVQKRVEALNNRTLRKRKVRSHARDSLQSENDESPLSSKTAEPVPFYDHPDEEEPVSKGKANLVDSTDSAGAGAGGAERRRRPLTANGSIEDDFVFGFNGGSEEGKDIEVLPPDSKADSENSDDEDFYIIKDSPWCPVHTKRPLDRRPLKSKNSSNSTHNSQNQWKITDLVKPFTKFPSLSLDSSSSKRQLPSAKVQCNSQHTELPNSNNRSSKSLPTVSAVQKDDKQQQQQQQQHLSPSWRPTVSSSVDISSSGSLSTNNTPTKSNINHHRSNSLPKVLPRDSNSSSPPPRDDAIDAFPEEDESVVDSTSQSVEDEDLFDLIDADPDPDFVVEGEFNQDESNAAACPPPPLLKNESYATSPNEIACRDTVLASAAAEEGDNSPVDNMKDARSKSSSKTGSSLPKVYISHKERKNGLSSLYDLDRCDVSRLKSLAFLQLTAIFDQENIPVKISIPRKVPKPTAKSFAVFGRPLTQLMEDEMKLNQFHYIMCPRFFTELLRHLINVSLTDEGILRKAGNTSRIKTYKHLIDTYFNTRPFKWSEISSHDAASLLKQFLLELPVPLLTFEFMHMFPIICQLDWKVSKRLEALNLLILMLPVTHSHSLKLLLIFLSKVVANEEKNLMSLDNVARIMTPNLFAATAFDPYASYTKASKGNYMGIMNNEMRKYQSRQEVLQLLINYHEQLWIVPDLLLTEMRFKNNLSRSPFEKRKLYPVLKNLFRISTRRPSLDLTDSANFAKTPAAATSSPPDTPIEFKVTHFFGSIVNVNTETCPTVGAVLQYVQNMWGAVEAAHRSQSAVSPITISHLTNNTTSQSLNFDCNQKPDKDANSHPPAFDQDGWLKALMGNPSKKLYLFEVGGNVTKRCLSDERLLISNLLALNPEAKLLIEFR